MTTINGDSLNGQDLAEHAATLEEMHRMELSQEQLDAFYKQVIDAVETHFTESAFNFRVNLKATGGNWSGPFLSHLVEEGDPFAKHLLEKLGTAVDGRRYPNAPGNPDDDLMQLWCRTQELSFIIGVFVGAKLQGASRGRLNEFADKLIV